PVMAATFPLSPRSKSDHPERSSRPGGAPFEKISTLDQRPHLAIGHASLEHPKAAVGMDVPHPVGAEHRRCMFEPPGDEVGRLDLVVLDVDHAEADPDPRVEIAQRLELAVTPPGEFEHQVVDAQSVEE